LVTQRLELKLEQLIIQLIQYMSGKLNMTLVPLCKADFTSKV